MIAIIMIIILYSLGLITVGVLLVIINNQDSYTFDETFDLPTNLVASQELIDYITTDNEEMPSSKNLVVVDETLDTDILLQYNTTDLDKVYHSNEINAFSKEIICDFKNNNIINNYTPASICYI